MRQSANGMIRKRPTELKLRTVSGRRSEGGPITASRSVWEVGFSRRRIRTPHVVQSEVRVKGESSPGTSNKGLGTVIQVIQEPSCDVLLAPRRTKFEGRFSMAMFWLSIALGVLGFAAIMFAIAPDDVQLLGEFPEFDPRYRGWTDAKR